MITAYREARFNRIPDFRWTRPEYGTDTSWGSLTMSQAADKHYQFDPVFLDEPVVSPALKQLAPESIHIGIVTPDEHTILKESGAKRVKEDWGHYSRKTNPTTGFQLITISLPGHRTVPEVNTESLEGELTLREMAVSQNSADLRETVRSGVEGRLKTTNKYILSEIVGFSTTGTLVQYSEDHPHAIDQTFIDISNVVAYGLIAAVPITVIIKKLKDRSTSVPISKDVAAYFTQ